MNSHLLTKHDFPSKQCQLRLIGDNSIANLVNQGKKLLQASSDSAKLDVDAFVLKSCVARSRNRERGAEMGRMIGIV